MRAYHNGDDLSMLFLALIDNETDRELFLRLYYEHRNEMFCHAECILEDSWLAEDAVQEAFIRIAKNINRIDFSKGPRALMLTIVRNTALTIKEKNCRETVLDNPDEYLDNSSDKLEDSIRLRVSAERIADIVDNMPSIYSDVFRLRYGHDMTYSQIAAVLGINIQTAKKRAQRARDEIKKELNGEI